MANLRAAKGRRVAKTPQPSKAHGPIQNLHPPTPYAEAKAVHKTDMEFWRKHDVHQSGRAFLTSANRLKTMRRHRMGRSICDLSVAGLRGLPGAAVLLSSKHGMMGLINHGRGLSWAAYTFHTHLPLVRGHPKSVSRNTAVKSRNVLVFQKKKHRAIMVTSNPHKRLIDVSEVTAAPQLAKTGPVRKSINDSAFRFTGGDM